MKGLDTPVLLAILHDAPPSKEVLRSLRGEEAATTELNMFELGLLAFEGPREARTTRESALSRLRRRVTVLPITAESVREATRQMKGKGHVTSFQPLVWSTLAAAGCSEWLTTRAFAPAKAITPFKVRFV
jgi:predicted nucleic acid-binding protein